MQLLFTLRFKMRCDAFLTGFIQYFHENVVLFAVSIHCSLQVTEKLLSFLVRVRFTEAFGSLRIRYKLSAQSGGEETISVYTVN